MFDNLIANMPAVRAIGIDLGGTRIKGALVDLASGTIIDHLAADTHHEQPGQWKTKVAEMICELTVLSGGPIRHIGIAAPGIASSDCCRIASMPGRMEGLEGVNWSTLVGQQVRVINDAHAALVAEAIYGSAQGCRHAIMLTLGTGVGGGLWLDGKLFRGHINRAGHMGHLSLDAESPILGITHTPGSLENAIGDATVAARTYNNYKSTEQVVSAYRNGEPLATLTWLTSVRQLAVSITSLVNVFCPEVVVLAGGIVKADDALFNPLEAFIKQFEWQPFGQTVPVRKARFEEWSGAIGAAAYATKDF